MTRAHLIGLLSIPLLTIGCARGPERVRPDDPSIVERARRTPDREATVEDDTVPPDRRLTFAVRQELLFDPDVRIRDVEVDAEDGTVTLSGTVDNLLAKQRAEALTRAVEGVREVINRLDVRSLDRQDKEIMNDVQQALRFDPVAAVSDIHVEVDDGIVTVRGRVGSTPERAFVEEIIKNVRGVRDVRNELTIDAPADPDAPADDAESDAVSRQ